MKNPFRWFVPVVVLALIIAGFCFFSVAGDYSTAKDARTPNLVAGVLCLTFGFTLLVVGVVYSRKDGGSE